MKNFDSYYDPPEYDTRCQICHYGEGHCTCPECETCGEVGNPACINTHMPFTKWGHFHFQRSEEELRKEADYEKSVNDAEKDLPEFPIYYDSHGKEHGEF